MPQQMQIKIALLLIYCAPLLLPSGGGGTLIEKQVKDEN